MTDLPVWSFAPNWANEVLERWEWFTDILSAETGPEQTAALRYAPRRSIEARYLLTGNEQARARLALQRAGSSRWLVPLWFHRARLTAAASPAPADILA